MLSLRDLQINFSDCIIKNQKSILNQNIQAQNLSATRRLQIYRNNILTTLTETLQNVYPTVQRVVGEEFFIALAHAYIQAHSSLSGNLYHYGCNFSQFLADFPPVTSLPYLPEVAQLDWAYHEVFHEKSSSNLDLALLKNISAEQYGSIKFNLNPANRLFNFQYPIFAIWKICQTNNPQENVNINADGDKVLIIRRGWNIYFEKLSAGEFALLQAFQDQTSFKTACAQALSVQPDFNIEASLKYHFQRETIVGFS